MLGLSEVLIHCHFPGRIEMRGGSNLPNCKRSIVESLFSKVETRRHLKKLTTPAQNVFA